MKLSTVKELSDLISAQLGCGCTYTRAVPVQKIYKDRVLWEGKVGVFQLAQQDRECYAWTDDAVLGESSPVIIVESEAVSSPLGAVEWYLQELCDTANQASVSSVQHAA